MLEKILKTLGISMEEKTPYRRFEKSKQEKVVLPTNQYFKKMCPSNII